MAGLLPREGDTSALDNAREARIYALGTWSEVTVARFKRHWIVFAAGLFSLLAAVLGFFLMGLRAVKTGWLFDRGRLLARMKWAVPAGLAASGVAEVVGYSGHGLTQGLAEALHEAGGYALSQGYVCGFLLLAPRLHALLAPVGRLALTNYLSHSLILTTLSYGYAGIGWYGRVSLTAGTALALVLYSLQIAGSHVWLRRFAQGPLERLWRLAIGDDANAPPSPG